MLKITNLQKTFNAGTVNAKTALDGLNLHIKEGDFVTVIGGNGAGKSTLQNAIAGVWKPDFGTIEIDGVDVTNMPEHKRAQFLGRVFQDPMRGTAPDMEIAENLAIASKRGIKRRFVRGVRKADREYYRELLKTLDLGLEDRLSTKVGLLSGGQRQAVTLLMASMNKPKLLLLDEHTAALDPKTAAKVLELTNKIVTENHLTTLMITHNMRDAIAYGNRLIMLHEGRVIVDVEGEEKQMLTVEDLLSLFVKASGKIFADDRAILAYLFPGCGKPRPGPILFLQILSNYDTIYLNSILEVTQNECKSDYENLRGYRLCPHGRQRRRAEDCPVSGRSGGRNGSEGRLP